ncbi:hypothetical protein F01_420830 [Burkholderia cenocepacia]|nr:hypothetical protein F01_420830 [Burkholderia cenocepacia]
MHRRLPDRSAHRLVRGLPAHARRDQGMAYVGRRRAARAARAARRTAAPDRRQRDIKKSRSASRANGIEIGIL